MLVGDEAELVVAAHAQRPERVCAPAVAVDLERERARRAGAEREGTGFLQLEGEPGRGGEPQLEAIARNGRDELELAANLSPCCTRSSSSRSVASSGAERIGESATSASSAKGAATAAGSGRPSASAATTPAAVTHNAARSRGVAKRVTRSSVVDFESDTGGCPRSSAAGVGTCSSSSATTSSPRSCCNHSSGASVSRCASAGTATAFTSSGVTKSRPWSTRLPSRELEQREPARGLAPTCTRGLSRVARTSRAM